MSTRSPRMLTGVLIGALLSAVVGCSPSDGDEDDVDTGDATVRLEQQREDVRAAARSLLVAAEAALPGATTTSSASYRGCESAFNEEFKNFRYIAQARVDVDPGSDVAAPYVESLQPVLEEAGFTVDDLEELPNGFVTLAGAKGELGATFTHTGAGAFVGLTVSGPCIDVPEDERDDWLLKDEPTPDIR